MRILLIIPSILRGGAEEYALTIASAAAKRGWEVHAAFPKTEGTTSLINDFSSSGVIYHPLKIDENNYKTKNRQILRFSRSLVLLLKLRPDVVQIGLPWPDRCLGSILACGLLKVPTAVVFQLASCKFSFKNKRLKAYDWARARNQRWIAVSEYNKKIICESFQIDPSEITTIYNGTKVLPTIDNNNEDLATLRDRVRHEIKVPTNSILALTVGRLKKRKGYADLIPTIPHITQEFPEVKFVWIGEGEDKAGLVKKLKEHGVEDKVLFLGYRSDVPRLLKAADLFVFPTHFEGLPFSLIEAMASNLPVIASDATSIPEIINNKVNGILFRTGDSCELLKALRWGLKYPEKMQKMAVNAKFEVEDFSEEKMVNETLKVLESLTRI